MRLSFIGGGNPLNGELEDVMDHMSKYIGTGNRILIIPFATEESKRDRWYQTVKTSFAKLGVSHVKTLEEWSTHQEIKEKIGNHDVLYFTGGRPEVLMRHLREKEMIKIIQHFSGLMIGVSAGALAFCRDCIITKDSDYPETEVIQGIGLVDFSVEVHYSELIDNELTAMSNTRDIYAIPNGSALFLDEGKLTPIQPIYVFNSGKKRQMTELEKVHLSDKSDSLFSGK